MRFEGAGVYYAATAMEAQLCVNDEIIIVGGGNSAGQAAVFLAQTAKRVNVLVRGEGLAETMSRYLIRRIEDHPAIVLRTRTEIVGARRRPERRARRCARQSNRERRDARRRSRVHDDRRGAEHALARRLHCARRQGIHQDRTGSLAGGSRGRRWTLPRPPYLLETSRPGVFAVGDVRSGNIKRVASAVGEGSIAVAFAHQVLHQ